MLFLRMMNARLGQTDRTMRCWSGQWLTQIDCVRVSQLLLLPARAGNPIKIPSWPGIPASIKPCLAPCRPPAPGSIANLMAFSIFFLLLLSLFDTLRQLQGRRKRQSSWAWEKRKRKQLSHLAAKSSFLNYKPTTRRDHQLNGLSVFVRSFSPTLMTVKIVTREKPRFESGKSSMKLKFIS